MYDVEDFLVSVRRECRKILRKCNAKWRRWDDVGSDNNDEMVA